MPIGHLTPIAPGTQPAVRPVLAKKYFLGGVSFPIFVFVVFELIFLAFNWYLNQSGGTVRADAATAVLAPYYGFIFGVASLVAMYIFYGLISIFGLGNIYWLKPAIAALAIFPCWFLASQPVYLENFFSAEETGAVAYYFAPFILASSICLGLCAAWFLIAVILSVINRTRR